MSDAQPPPPPAGGSSPPPPPGPPPPPDPATVPHDNIKANLYASTIICWALAAIFVAIRFYTRGVIIRVLNWSDWFILLALIFSAGSAAALIDQTIHGSGSHLWDLDPTDLRSAIAWMRAGWYGILCYALSLFFSKMSILTLYLNLFAFKWARRAVQALMVLVVLTGILMVVTTLTAAIPLNAYWDFTIPRDQVYMHPQSLWWANTGTHMVTDVLIFLLPMPVVWSIMLPRRQKMMLFCVFGIGFIVCFVSILRVPKLWRNEKGLDANDFTYAAVELSYLTSVEVNGAIVCASVMTLKPFVARFFPGIIGSLQSRSSSSRRSAVGMRGPPTIGSAPSKQPLSAADSELMGKIGGSVGSGRRAGAWSDPSAGYVEIDDWALDVELAEGVKTKKSSIKSEETKVDVSSGASDDSYVTKAER